MTIAEFIAEDLAARTRSGAPPEDLTLQAIADLYAVSDTTITQTGRAIEGFLLLLASFLLLNLLISGGMAAVNGAVLGRLRRSR